MAQRDPLPPPSASWHSGRLDVLLDEESILGDVLAVARPAIKRGGPVACIAAYTLEHLRVLRDVRRGLEREAGL